MLEPRVLTPNDFAAITQFEKQLLAEQIVDEVERELASWHVSWRKESLDHYLPIGWSFGLWRGQDLVGYFLAQPQLFVRSMTQTLWVEHLSAPNPESRAELIEVAYRMAREKHFQKVLFHFDEKPEHLFELKTAKF